jgi:CDP-glycerol glycerophosphotransferase (TagB/SpsB family)
MAAQFINTLIPKRKNQIFFSSTSIFKDNVSAVLDEFLKHDISKHFRIVLDGNGLEEYKGNNIEHVKHKSIKSIWRFLRSKYIIYDNGVYGSRSVKNQISVNIWHGMGLKKIGYYCMERKKKYKQTATYVIAYSSYFKSTMSHAFGVPLENVIITGDPRNDYFFTDSNSLKMIGINKSNYNGVICWMPTYRISCIAESAYDGADYEYGIPLINSENINILDDCLCERGIILIIKYHSLQNISLPNKQLKNIKFLTSEEVMQSKEPLYCLLSHCDALITDYSSVYFNYLLLNRPICFAYDDLELYSSKRGFMFNDIESMMPGFKAKKFEQILEFINDFSLGVDNYKEDRIKANKKYNTYQDSNNSYRILQKIGITD